ncbi:NACHT, LRR and PYD domains-containing protein 3-like isoform X12 [Ctenopharyngodon idella]|uniref:NACHT, LRR and PYD domains-containing protein 3-like isoform X12 n=1 Tax=Ctenopharyngodon idella TaxID=7959 RepID=UPI00222E4067|nr:NACHT, LRR and PYD domains-containing protein 3-like isoform X12 [Ctenopharyngodon idella]
MSLSEKQSSVRSGSDVSSSVSVKSDRSKDDGPNFSEKTPPSVKSVRSGSHVSSSVSVKSDRSKDDGPNFNEKIPPSANRLQWETLDSDFHPRRNRNNFKDKLLDVFQDLESKIIKFLKDELEKFKKILQKENTQNFVKDFNDNRCSIKEAALDLTLHYLRDMKQDEAADTLEDELVFIHHLKYGLKKKYQCVFEGIAKQGDSTLLNNIYTDLYITQGGSERVNTEHEVRQIEVASRRHQSQEIPIECTKMFEAPEQDKEIRTVLTKGVAGIGKTISVQKFVLDWAEGKENQDISFIFPLPFREMNLKEIEKSSLMDLITQFFPETKGLNLTRRKNFKVLFILDGLDECRLPLKFDGNETWRDVSSPASLDVILTNLMKGNLLPSALIWITTRPAAASKIPPDCIDRVTEIRGFNDAQKEEYFRKRFTDEKMTNVIFDHVKKSKSLFIMCHIPVFCWISATVLQNILEEKINNDLKNSHADETSITLQESNTEDTPKTLTQMYAHFLRFQIQQSRRKYDGEYRPDVSLDKDTILSLGKLAFQQLERSNVIFYESDLEACGIDVYKASVCSGMCTQIFKEETGITLGTMYCFVHLSIQEFIAALYAHLFLDINKKSVFVQESTEQEYKNETMIDVLKTAVDKALKSDNGHLDLFLRFFLSLSLQSNRRLLQGLLTQQDGYDQSKKEIVQYIKQKLEGNLSPERSINLFYCLNELNDQTLVKEIQTQLREGSLSFADLSPAQWSALVFVLLTSEKELEEFELQKFKKSDECLIRLLAVIKTSKRALLNDSNLTDRSCSALATILGSDTELIELNMNNNNLQDSGLKLLCTGLKNIKCKLERLKLSDCSITEEGYKALASALRSNPSHLIELDLTGNDPGQSGVKELTDLLQDGRCTYIRFLKSPAAEEACEYLTEVLGKSPFLLTELDLSEDKLGDLDGEKKKEHLALLMDSHSKLETIKLNNCVLTEKSCSVLATVLSSKTILKELNLNNSRLLDSGVKQISEGLKNPVCELKILKLSDCSITEEGYKALASALRSNPSHLIELDLTRKDPGQSGVKELTDLLQDPNCQLKLRFLSPAADEACEYVRGIVGKNPLLLRELNLSERELGDTGVNQIAALLKDKHCKLNTLILCRCSIKEKQCFILTSSLKSNLSHLRELNLSGNKLGDSGGKHLCDVLKDSHSKLERLRLTCCEMTNEGCSAVTSALKSNPSHLRELDLSGNKLGDSGVKHLSDVLKDSHCKLERLRLTCCKMTNEGCSAVTSALKLNPSHLRELDLSGNKLGDSEVKHLHDVLKDSHSKLERLRLTCCEMTNEGCSAVTSALKSHLRELDLSGNKLGDSGVNNLSVLLINTQCKLEKLHLCECSITEKQCLILTSALSINPSHLRELDLSGNEIKNTVCYILKDSRCKLERLSLNNCGITDVSLTQSLTNTKVLQFLKELDLRNNNIGDSKEQLRDVLRDSNCKLRLDSEMTAIPALLGGVAAAALAVFRIFR